MRTEHNYSPLQLLTHLEPSTAADVEDPDNYGVEDDENSENDNEDIPLVECNAVECPLNNEQLVEFKERIQPIALLDSFQVQRSKYFDALLTMNDIFYH